MANESEVQWSFQYDSAKKKFVALTGRGRHVTALLPRERVNLREKSDLYLQDIFERCHFKYDPTRKIILGGSDGKEYLGSGSVFGVKLDKLMEMDKAVLMKGKKLPYPMVVDMLFRVINRHGFKVDRMLTKPVNPKKVHGIKALMAKDFYGNIKVIEKMLKKAKMKIAVNILKFFLRNLPGTLFTEEYGDAFAHLGDIPQKLDRFKALKLLIFQLPDVNVNILYELLCILSKIAAQSKRNHMDVNTIVRVMTPNLFEVKPGDDATATPFELMTMLVENVDLLFDLEGFIERWMDRLFVSQRL